MVKFNFHVNISNKVLYALIAILILFTAVVAYNPVTKVYDNLAPNPGHYATQIWVAVKTIAGGYDEMTVQDAVDTGRMATLIRDGNDLFHPDGNVNVQGAITVNQAVNDASAGNTLVTKDYMAAYTQRCDDEEYLDGDGDCINASEIVKQAGGVGGFCSQTTPYPQGCAAWAPAFCQGKQCACPAGMNRLQIGPIITTSSHSITGSSVVADHEHGWNVVPSQYTIPTIKIVGATYVCVNNP